VAPLGLGGSVGDGHGSVEDDDVSIGDVVAHFVEDLVSQIGIEWLL
jgi:hypothetical protein